MAQNIENSNSGMAHTKSDELDTFPANILVGNFWLFSADRGSPQANYAWIQTDGSVSQNVESAILLLRRLRQGVQEQSAKTFPSTVSDHPINHYLLLPAYDWGISEWHLNAIRPFIHHHQPTIGFSVKEASLASRVTVVGGIEQFSEQVIKTLRASGSIVERIDGDGMSIATQLSQS
jgi:hypothetical protein